MKIKRLVLTMAVMGSAMVVNADTSSASPRASWLLKPEAFRHYVEAFNKNDDELFQQSIPNAHAWEFLERNIPLLDCPDKEIEEIYYFRWWTYRKQIKETPVGFVITEFLPQVPWSGKYNTISCAAGHHLREGRWLLDRKYMDDYTLFWLRKGGAARLYSFWIADSVWQRYCVTGDRDEALDLLPDLIKNYQGWEKERRDSTGLYWQSDNRDGMECSIGGSGYRATINTYQYGDARAIARIAELAGNLELAREYNDKAAAIKGLVQQKLWDDKAQFFKVLPKGENKKLSDARELHGLTPWYCDLPDADKSVAWKQLMDPQGFYAPYGPTSAEQRHPRFRIEYLWHECRWNGPSWPFATAITLTALANLLNDYQQDVVGRKDYFETLKIYAKSQHRKLDDGRIVPWIDENLNPTNGDWIARTRLKTWKNGTWDPARGGVERGKDYNHSTYCDLIITGLIGLRPRADETVEVNPLLPDGLWDYFCLDRIPYHGRTLTILWDKTGKRYGKGAGLHIVCNGKEIATADKLTRVTGTLQ